MVVASQAADRTAEPALSSGARPARFRIDAVIVVTAALVLLRAVAYLRFEQLEFDSDQAIIGLMAKHLVEGRALPLFFYGQTYLLAVESWVAALFFAIGGPNVFTLRLSILAWNIAAAVLLVKGLQQNARLRPWVALVPALFFILAPPSIASQLMAAQGAIIEPFVYVGVLWFLRDRPLWFGAVLGVGTLNREFTLYAVPALLLVQLLEGRPALALLRQWLLVLIAFFVVWESVEALKPYADLMGPGTRGELIRGYSGSQVGNLVDRFNWSSAEVATRVTTLGAGMLAWFSGARQLEPRLPVAPHAWLAVAAGIAILLAALRTAWLLFGLPNGGSGTSGASLLQRLVQRLQAQVGRAGFAVYLLAVGATAAVVFVAAKPLLDLGYSRYALLGLLAPAGLIGVLLSLEPGRLARRAVIGIVVAWAAVMAADHAKMLLALERQPPPNPKRQLADYLVAHDITAAAGGYWRAYEITFLTRERVRIASQDFVRIDEYQRLYAETPRAPVLRETPCPGGAHVGGMYVCSP